MPPGVLVLPAFVVLAALLAASAVSAQRESERNRVMWVSATDRNGAPVTGLNVDDFTVREDGAQREILSVEPATTPIEITIVADTSAATESSMPDIRRGLTDFVTEMAKGNHIAVTTFGGPPKIVQGYTSNLELLKKGVSLFPQQDQGGYLLEGLMSVASGIMKRAPERAVIVTLLVRGTPEFSNVQRDKVMTALIDCGAALDAIVIQTGAPTPAAGSDDVAAATRDREAVLDEVSRATGGINEQAVTSLAVQPQLKALATQLRSQYRLVYSRPESLIPPKKIAVSAKKQDVTVRANPAKAGK